ncbi:MAG: hypothetical protein C3F06_02400 [Candidatus Methanoperedenaceae archaeon]|nr:MAG: hypothetical protein C3F06_02400 [Candidatus Methanoperedenaceae archaeon]
MNTHDTVISILGDSGKQQWTRSEIMEILSEQLRIEKREAGQKFDVVNNRFDYFEKTSDDSQKYHFSKSGNLKYKSLKKLKESERGFNTAVERFIRNYYWNEFLECIHKEKEYIEIDYQKIWVGFHYLKDLLEKDPDEALSKFNKAIQKISVPADNEKWPGISIFNTGEILQVEDVKTEQIGQFIEIEGRVVAQNLTQPKIVNAAFKCKYCGEIMILPQSEGKFVEPYQCDSCERKGQFILQQKPESDYIDAQNIILESIRGGQVNIKVALNGCLCRPPWERDAKVVHICGIVRAWQKIGTLGKSPYFEWVVDVNSIKIVDDNNVEPPTEDEIKQFEQWAKNPHELRKKLLSSIAPNIFGMMDIKDACSLSLFSDWNWELDPRNVIDRSSIHVLLFGDPGIAKSQIIKDVVYIAPKGKFGQVVNMSRGGLSTVAVQEKGEWFVKSGFFSQADQGVAGLDEIDKVKDPKDLDCLVSVLNDQIQLVSKIGKNDIPFNTRTAVLGAANPKGGHLRISDDIIEQIQATIPSYIFQRFDLIFVIPDIPDKERDSIVVDTINERYRTRVTNRKNLKRDVPMELLQKYILYARTKPLPEIELSAQKLIKEYYLKIRQISKEYPVIGARQVEDLNRMSLAVARREMAAKVSEEHVKYAMGLMKAALSTLSSGNDYGMYNYGRTKSQADQVKSIRNAIKELCVKESYARIEDIASLSGMDMIQVEHTIILMEKNKEVYHVTGGYRLP